MTDLGSDVDRAAKAKDLVLSVSVQTTKWLTLLRVSCGDQIALVVALCHSRCKSSLTGS
jgi:hypothetical protein